MSKSLTDNKVHARMFNEYSRPGFHHIAYALCDGSMGKQTTPRIDKVTCQDCLARIKPLDANT